MAKRERITDRDGEFLTEARRRFQEGVDFDRENRAEAMTDLDMLVGKQWDDAVLESRKGRPSLVINTLPQFVAQVVGDIRINRPAIRVRPAEDADKDLAEIREGLIRAIERDSDAQGVYASAGQSQVACGMGSFRVSLKYASDEAFDRDIAIEGIGDPLSVVWDPFMKDGTGRDARYCFIPRDLPKKVFEELYGDEAPVGELGDECMRDGWWSADAVRLSEYWVLKETPTKIALMQDGKTLDVADPAYDPALVQQKANGQPYLREVMRKSVCMYLITGHKVLEGPVEWPISRVPIIRVPGWEVHIGRKRVRFGLIRFARDSQRLKNYWRSAIAESLAIAPKQHWLVHEQNEGDAEDFRSAHSSGDSVLTWKGPHPPQRVAPPPVNIAMIQEAALNAQDIKDVTGLHDASLGAKSNETSGKAIMARQREGDVATYVYHDNLQAGIREAGRLVNELIPITYDTARTIRVIGEDDATKIQRINDPNSPESIDIAQGKYDIVVETGPSYSTKRVEAAESMMQFVQSVPVAGQLAGDLIAKSQDWPGAEIIAERLKKALPPGIAEQDDEDMTPEKMQAMAAQQQAAQQQQAMQMQAAQLELAEKQADVRKKEADADKATAEAEKAQIELAAMNGQIENVAQNRAAQMLFSATQQAAQNFGQGQPNLGQPAPGADLAA